MENAGLNNEHFTVIRRKCEESLSPGSFTPEVRNELQLDVWARIQPTMTKLIITMYFYNSLANQISWKCVKYLYG